MLQGFTKQINAVENESSDLIIFIPKNRYFAMEEKENSIFKVAASEMERAQTGVRALRAPVEGLLCLARESWQDTATGAIPVEPVL